jgi:hypothetical protein
MLDIALSESGRFPDVYSAEFGRLLSQIGSDRVL